jgi:arginine deiminase
MVCPPGRAHERLNCHDLWFDDVIWVQEARKDHFDFVLKMRDRGVEVLDFSVLLGEAMEDPEARRFVLQRRVTRNTVGPVIAEALYPWLEAIPGGRLSELLIGGVAVQDVPPSESSVMLGDAMGETSFLIPPIPNTLFQRDSSCWIYNGVTCNPMYWPARQPETLLQRVIYKFRPIFKGGDFHVWFGDSDENFGASTIEGGDVMPVGKGVVLIGMGERTTRQAVAQVAQILFDHQAATRVIG